MKLKAKAKRAGLNESEARDLKLLARALGIRIRSVEVIPAEKQAEPKGGRFSTMTSKPVKYAYTLHNPRSVPNGTIDGVVDMLPDISSETWEACFDTVEAAVEDARLVWRDNHGYYPTPGEYVAVAPYTPWDPDVGEHWLLDDLCSAAYEAADDAADDWVEELGKVTREDLQELHSGLRSVLREWLKKHDLEPQFGTVDTAKATYCPLWEGAGA